MSCSVGDVSATFDEHGNLMQQSRSDQLSELMWGVIADAFKYSNECSEISPNESLKDFFVKEASQKDLNEDDKKVLLQMSEIWGGFIGDRQSNRQYSEHLSIR